MRALHVVRCPVRAGKLVRIERACLGGRARLSLVSHMRENAAGSRSPACATRATAGTCAQGHPAGIPVAALPAAAGTEVTPARRRGGASEQP